MGRSPMALRARSLGRLCREYEAQSRTAPRGRSSNERTRLCAGRRHAGNGQDRNDCIRGACNGCHGQERADIRGTTQPWTICCSRYWIVRRQSAAGGGAGRCAGEACERWPLLRLEPPGKCIRGYSPTLRITFAKRRLRGRAQHGCREGGSGSDAVRCCFALPHCWRNVHRCRAQPAAAAPRV